jgi:hypothetical protein
VGKDAVKIRDAYGNSKAAGYTIDYFALAAPEAKEAFLASPFFTTFEPIKLLTSRGCKVRLLVRLCPITLPTVMRQALNDPNVAVRYYTCRTFHAKLYIIDDAALIGSANLTDAGLKTNREVSVVLRKDRDTGFDDLPAMFNLFWEHADVFTSEICSQYERAFAVIGRPKEDKDFQAILEKFIPASLPPNANVGSELVSKRRSFLQSLRRKYDEELIPAFNEVRRVFEEVGLRRPEFANGDVDIELGRFLGWLRIARAPGDDWKATPLLEGAERQTRIKGFLGDWHSIADTTAGDMVRAEDEVANIQRLRAALGSAEAIARLPYDELFTALTAVHAFYDRLRFVAGGLPGLRADFAERNRLDGIKDTLSYLLHGPGTTLERAYDCLYSEQRRLSGFGEACTMELIGWMDVDRPPINGRTIKALRFLGFDVRD